MRTRALRDDDDDDAFDKNGMLKDGRRFSVPMTMMDSLQREVSKHFTDSPLRRDPIRVTDANGNDGVALCRPGFRMVAADKSGRDAKEEAYREYEKSLATAYLDADNTSSPTGTGSHGFVGAQAGDICTCRGPEYPDDFGSAGHLQIVNGAMVCVPDQPRTKQRSTTPARTDAAKDNIQKSHRENMSVLHDTLDAELREAWRHAR